MKYTATYPTVSYGDSGEIVIQLQDLLSKSGSSVRIDGEFRVGTLSAVRAFQKRNGLTVNGIVGSDTWTTLLEKAGNIKVTDQKKETKVSVLVRDLTEKEASAILKRYPKAIING